MSGKSVAQLADEILGKWGTELPTTTHSVNVDSGTPDLMKEAKLYGIDTSNIVNELTSCGMIGVNMAGSQEESFKPGKIFLKIRKRRRRI